MEGKRNRVQSKNKILKVFKEHIPLRWAPSLLQNVTSHIEPVDLIDLNSYCSFTNSSKSTRSNFRAIWVQSSQAQERPMVALGKVVTCIQTHHKGIFGPNLTDYNPFSNPMSWLQPWVNGQIHTQQMDYVLSKWLNMINGHCLKVCTTVHYWKLTSTAYLTTDKEKKWDIQ